MILRNYLFSQVSGDYQQYMSDHSELFLKQLCRNCNAPNQIAIHRDGNLIYYAYAHKKDESEILGICIVCGEVCLNLQWLYEYFQKVLEASANKGVLFCYDEQGQIRKNVDKFSSEVAEVDDLSREIREYIDKYQSYWESLPPEDFSIPIDSKISFAFNEDEKEKITDAIRHYHNVVVTMDNTAPSSFARTVERLHSERILLQEEKTTLENEIESLLKQKKQYRKVVSLGIFTVLLVVAAFFLYQALNGTQEKLSNTEAELEEKWQKLIEVRNEKDSINSLLSNTQYELAREKEKQLAIVSNIQSRYPAIISSTSFDFSKGKLTINYSQAKDTTQYIKIFATRESDGKRVGTSAGNLQFYEEGGSITATFGSHNFSSSDWYSFEIWVNNKLVGGGRH